MEAGQAFIHRSRRYLTKDYLPRIQRAVEALSEEDVWWRPNPASNSVGNLILHLAGNARQWVVSGIGKAPDVRQRDEEFRRPGEGKADALLTLLEGTLAEVDRVLAELPAAELGSERVIQGMNVTVLDALYHVVEHFSMHTGQIIYVAKLRSGRDLGFWEVKDGRAVPRW